MSRLLIILWLLCVVSVATAQQRQLSGTVSNSDGEPLGGVAVKVMSGKRIRTFTRTSGSGDYLIKIPEGDSLSLRFERMSYAAIEVPVPSSSRFDVTMRESPTEIREVVISAPSVKVRGDTLSFNVAAFIGKGDVSLEDALKKIPGISVASNGAIRYLGKDISKFYVEGLDMLGGRYSLATRNLPADYVSAVEVISNHNERKIDAGKHSDNVALNVKLKSSVKIRPVGTYEGGLGYVDKRALYHISGTAMVFRPKQQTLVNVKGGNISGFASSDMIVHYGGNNESSRAEEILPGASTGRAPVNQRRYENVRDWLVSANSILKTSKDATMRINASYASNHSGFSYSTLTEYFTGGDNLSIEEVISPSMITDKPSLEVDYTLNADNKYLKNTLKASGEISRQELGVVSNGVPLNQQRRMRSVNISDYFNFSTKIGNKKWNFDTRINYNNNPLTRLSISHGYGSNIPAGTQTVKNSSLTVTQNGYASWRFNKSSLYLPVSVRYEYCDIYTGLFRDTEAYTNRISANIANISISPSYSYELPGNKMELRASMPMVLNIIMGDNRATGESMNVTRPNLTPNIYLFYKFNGNSELNFSGGYNFRVGDILSLLGNPVQTSFRNFVTRSGIIARTRGWQGNLGYKYQRPFDYWFIRTSLTYSSTKRNTMSSSYITEGETYITDILSPNSTDAANATVTLSKTFNRIKTKIDGSVSGTWSRRETVQQNIPVRYYGRGITGRVTVDCTPVRWMSLSWKPGISYTVSSYLKQSSSYTDFSENFRLLFFPVRGVQIIGELEHVRTPVSDGVYKNIALLDCSVVWKHGKWRLTMSLDNILNRKHYRYTVFSGLDTRHVDYTLKGRCAVASVAFTL
ncbi:MAG: hypothetical protein K2H50_04885 [Paramuribaculum sp.]|nr:hypothetical protein [Paramuribaculum sp.]